MKSLGLVGLLALLGTGCYREYGPGPVAPMGNIQPDPVAVAGPPGGAVDPGYAYDQPNVQDPALPGYPAGYPEGYPAGSEDGQPADPYAAEASGGGGDEMGNVTDAQIDATLAPYGQWSESEEYGRVWRPDATVVGASFTPYETCGSWVWTDYGWTYSCDWNWGWLPFHYGNWDFFDGGWAWIPDYTWGPGWVDWRYGGGYVGWRPSRPREIVRDHRGNRPYVPKSSREGRDSHWRFVAENSLGRGRVHGNLVAPSHALAATATVSRLPFRGRSTVSAAALMSRGRGNVSRTNPYAAPGRPAYRGQSVGRYPSTFDNRTYPRGVQPPRYSNSRGTYPPRYDQRQPTRVEPGRTYQPPRPGVYQQPSRGSNPPSRGTYNPPSRPSGGYNPPSRPSGGYNPPSRPSGGSYSPPSRPSGGSYSPPSRSSSSGSSARPSSSSSGSSRGSSSSGSSRGSSSSGGSRGKR
jgi:hypothetical protein